VGCREARQQLDDAGMRVVQFEAEITALEGELAEALKLVELQKADLDRYEKAIAANAPHRPERTVREQIQLGWARVLQALDEELDSDASDSTLDALNGMKPPGSSTTDGEGNSKPRGHGRRPMDLSKLPLKLVKIDPAEVIAAGGAGFRLIGEETSSRVGYRFGGYLHVKLVRRKWARVGVHVVDLSTAGLSERALPPVVIADIPDCLWPRFLADPSAVANVIVSKYGDVLPLNRQETISKRAGFPLKRSTLCNWLGEAHRALYRVVDAMLADARQHAFCIATDATGAPVKGIAGCEPWHVFVFVADSAHIIFRHTKEHNGKEVSKMLEGFHGYLLADASSVYHLAYRTSDITESGCWAHLRRYFWKAVETDSALAYEALALISQLFAIERDCKQMSAAERKKHRGARAGPIVEALDRWVEHHRGEVDPRGRIHAALTYYNNQRLALRQFLVDGRLSIHNNVSERALRNLVLGRLNWLYFQNETGLEWYTVFRSLIASCALHDLNPQRYLEQVLRLAPHWPVTRMLDLAPKFWAGTIERLDDGQRAIIAQPWALDDQLVDHERAQPQDLGAVA